MLKIFLYIICFSNFAFAANSEIMCAKNWGFKLKKEIADMNVSDKIKHCSLSCQVRIHCTASGTLALGLAKEIWDGVSGTGTADWKDLEADYKGVQIGSIIRAESLPYPHPECISRCELLPWDLI